MSSTGNDIVALHAIDRQRTGRVGFYSRILSACELALYEQQVFPYMSFEQFVWLSWSVKESVYKYLKRTETGLIFSPTKIIVQQVDPPGGPATPFGGRQWENGGVRCAAGPVRTPWESGAGSGADSGKGSGAGEGAGEGEGLAADSGEGFYTGGIVYGSRVFFFRSKVFAECIATVVGDEVHFKDTWWGIQMITDPSMVAGPSMIAGPSKVADPSMVAVPSYACQSKTVRDFAEKRLQVVFSGDGDDFRIGKSLSGYPIIYKGGKEMKTPLSLAHHGRFVAYSFVSGQE